MVEDSAIGRFFWRDATFSEFKEEGDPTGVIKRREKRIHKQECCKNRDHHDKKKEPRSSKRGHTGSQEGENNEGKCNKANDDRGNQRDQRKDEGENHRHLDAHQPVPAKSAQPSKILS